MNLGEPIFSHFSKLEYSPGFIDSNYSNETKIRKDNVKNSEHLFVPNSVN